MGIIGRIQHKHRGTWSASAAYAPLEIVTSLSGYAAYVAKTDVPAGTPLSDANYWGEVLDVSDVIDNLLAARLDAAAALVMTAEGSPVQVWPDEGSLLRPVTTFSPRQPGGTPWIGGAGKNMLPQPQTMTQNGVTIAPTEDGGVRITGTCTLSAGSANVFQIPAIGGDLTGSYVLSAGNAEAVGDHLQLRLLDNAGSIAGDANFAVSSADAWKAFTYATARTIASYAIRTGGGVTYDVTIYPQLEAGTVKTDFEQYEHISPIEGWTEAELTRSGNGAEDLFTIAFGQTVYGGSVDWNAGVLTIDWALADIGAQAWYAGGSGNTARFQLELADIRLLAGNSYIPEIVCEAFPTAAWNSMVNDGADNIITQPGDLPYVAIRCTAYADAESFKAAMSGRYFAYRLANPASIQLTPTRIAALSGLNTLYADCDGMTLSYNKSLARDREELIARIAALESALINA